MRETPASSFRGPCSTLEMSYRLYALAVGVGGNLGCRPAGVNWSRTLAIPFHAG